jgi:hypothetical protein
MNGGWVFMQAFFMLFLWISAWNLIEETIVKFVKTFAMRAVVYAVMFVLALIAAALAFALIPEDQMNGGWMFLQAFLVLFLWIGAWNLVDPTIMEFVQSYKMRMGIYAIMFTVAIVMASLVFVYAPHDQLVNDHVSSMIA